MRKFLATTGLVLVLAGCSSETVDRTNPSDSGGAGNAAADAESRLDAVPGPLSRPSSPAGETGTPEVRPEAAPDVAFGYRYNFGLAADRVAEVQQRHARTCEELGTSRCRVTGMSYRRTGDDDVQAELSLALEPSLAHRFGERAMDAVREAEGELVDSQITGTDVGTGIRANNRSIADLEEELRTIEQRIAADGRDEAKAGLQEQAEQLRRQIRSLQDVRSEQRESLAITPVTLTYGSGAYMSGRPDFGRAVDNAWDQLVWGAYMVFVLFTVLLPWLIAAGLIWLAVAAIRRRRPHRPAVANAEPLA